MVSKFYNPQRSRNLFDPSSKEIYKLSRSKIELFKDCPQCFYLDRRLGVGRPPGYPFTLNSAVDALLKKEFDQYRKKKKPHPLMVKFKIGAIPFEHEKLDSWRDSLHGGIQFQIPNTNILFTGGIDDVWMKPNGELIIVDYKATSKNEEVTLDAEWQDGYKRQMEIYQWLFRQNNFAVSTTGIFVYCNGLTDAESFDSKLTFDIKIIPYIGKTDWVEPFINSAIKCLTSNEVPKPNDACDYCRYRDAVQTASAHRNNK